MKGFQITILLLIAYGIVVTWLLWDKSATSNDKIRILKSEIKGHKHNFDSAVNSAEITRDSLEIAFTTIMYLNADKQKAHNETVKWMTKYESIRFKPLT